MGVGPQTDIRNDPRVISALELLDDRTIEAVASLVDVGLVNRIQRGASSSRYDAAVKDHAHCRCIGCDGVWDAPHNAMPQGKPEKFEVVHVNVEFVGYCANCRRQKIRLAPLNATIKYSSPL